jgi:predicted dehydrogenase
VAVRLGFLGAGFIADYHARMLAASGASAVIGAVFDPAEGRSASFCARHGGQPVDSEDAVLDSVDAVYVCTWTSEHPRLVAAAAARGLPVFCEKPLAVSLEAAVATARSAAGVVNQVGLVLRDSPAFRLLRAMVDDPADGPVLNVVFRDDQYLPTRGVYGSTWRADPTRAGAGTLLEHSIHDLDLLEWLFGDIVAISSRMQYRHGLPGIEDVAVVVCEFASGATATLTSVWHDVLGRPSLRRMEVFRQRAWYALEGDVVGPLHWVRTSAEELAAADRASGGAGPRTTGDRIGSPSGAAAPGTTRGEEGWASGEPVPPTSLQGRALVGELASRGMTLRFPDAGFVEAVAAGTPASPSMADALRAHVLADAAYRSAASDGGWVQVPPGVPTH